MKATFDQRSAIYSSVGALAKELGISRQSAYAGLRTGSIPSIRLGRRFIIPKAAIAKWLESAGRSPELATLK